MAITAEDILRQFVRLYEETDDAPAALCEGLFEGAPPCKCGNCRSYRAAKWYLEGHQPNPANHPGRISLAGVFHAYPDASELLTVWNVDGHVSMAHLVGALDVEDWGGTLAEVIHQIATGAVEKGGVRYVDDDTPLGVDEVKDLIRESLLRHLENPTAVGKEWNPS